MIIQPTQIASFTARAPHLMQALSALALRTNQVEQATELFDELCGITLLVAKKFTNERTADGMQEAFFLTVGCISLGISQAKIAPSDEAKLDFLLLHGAEQIFQQGFRHIKELSALPYATFITDFENDAFIQQRNLKTLFVEICRADPAANWTGDNVFNNELLDRQHNQNIIKCALWLRKHNAESIIKDSELDASAVISIAVIFGIAGDARIVARLGQKDVESLVKRVRELQPDVTASWGKLLQKIPVEFHEILRERMAQLQPTIIKKIIGKTRVKTIVTEMQDFYAGNEQDIEYP
ncbi:MAG: hypothetical protein PHP57_00755 [Sideroxydans sp.]|nr:hypothetical protein [Sideroxydans sp.]